MEMLKAVIEQMNSDQEYTIELHGAIMNLHERAHMVEGDAGCWRATAGEAKKYMDVEINRAAIEAKHYINGKAAGLDIVLHRAASKAKHFVDGQIESLEKDFMDSQLAARFAALQKTVDKMASS